jgi:hypothetical protein
LHVKIVKELEKTLMQRYKGANYNKLQYHMKTNMNEDTKYRKKYPSGITFVDMKIIGLWNKMMKHWGTWPKL